MPTKTDWVKRVEEVLRDWRLLLLYFYRFFLTFGPATAGPLWQWVATGVWLVIVGGLVWGLWMIGAWLL